MPRKLHPARLPFLAHGSSDFNSTSDENSEASSEMVTIPTLSVCLSGWLSVCLSRQVRILLKTYFFETHFFCFFGDIYKRVAVDRSSVLVFK